MERQTPLDFVIRKTLSTVAPSRFPSRYYESLTGMFGGRLEETDKVVFVTEGFTGKLDHAGDRWLRRMDFYELKSLGDFWRNICRKADRRRGTPGEIWQNVQRLGLTNEYGYHKRGVEILDPEGLLYEGITLYDIFESKTIGSPRLQSIDRFQALTEATRYLRGIHDKYGPTGDSEEDIVFKAYDGGIVGKPVLAVPDVVYDASSKLTDDEKKAYEMAEYMIRIAALEKKNGDTASIANALNIICENYENDEVIKLIAKFTKQGRLPMAGDEKTLQLPESFFTNHPLARKIATIHNVGRLGAKIEDIGLFKNLIIDACEEYIWRSGYLTLPSLDEGVDC